MALAHDTGHHSNGLSICWLAVAIVAIVAIAVPFFQLAVNMAFGLFE